eukprot:g5349.t1
MGKQTDRNKKKGVEHAPKKQDSQIDVQPDFDVLAMPTREIVKPEIQLALTETELEDEIPQMLTANNPEAPHNVTRFHTKERVYKLEAMVEQCTIHYATDGWLLHKESEEGKKQIEMDKLLTEAIAKMEAETAKNTDEATDDSKQLRNQFNYSDRACQTVHPQRRARGCYTEPPQTTVRCGKRKPHTSLWDIYDDYYRDIETQKAQEQQNKRRSAGVKKTKTQEEDARDTRPSNARCNADDSVVSLRAAKVVERMTMQNIFDEVIMDLKYWDDNSDEFRPNEASLLPLWSFLNNDAKGKQVTALCPNTKYSDVFAVGYGSYESLKQTTGMICVYSLKNPLLPERTVLTESGVLTIAFHPDYPNLLAAGCYDGSVRVLDIKGDCDKPLYVSDGEMKRHTEPVWEVSWKADAVLGELQLFSASSDGTVGLWTFTRSEMLFEIIMTCNHPSTTDNSASKKHGLLSLDFNKVEEANYVLGTEEGVLYRCSTEFDSEHLDCYLGHELPVYSVKWNFFHEHVFLSASEDWTVKLWDSRNCKHPITKFELNSPVTGVAWAPYSATVFVAITDTGNVYGFDLSCNRHTALCEQKVISKGRLTRVMFHPRHPLLFIGDSTGQVLSFKLSPNLRQQDTNNDDTPSKTNEQQQLNKLNTVLEQLRLSIVGQ